MSQWSVGCSCIQGQQLLQRACRKVLEWRWRRGANVMLQESGNFSICKAGISNASVCKTCCSFQANCVYTSICSADSLRSPWSLPRPVLYRWTVLHNSSSGKQKVSSPWSAHTRGTTSLGRHLKSKLKTTRAFPSVWYPSTLCSCYDSYFLLWRSLGLFQ